MSGAILVKRTTSGALPVNAPAGTSVGTLSPYYIQGDKYDLGSSLTGAVAIDLTDQDVIRNQFSGTLVGNVTIAFTSPPAPMAWHIHLSQNGTGGFTVGWPVGVRWLNSESAPAMPQYANEDAVYSFVYDGTEITGTMSYKGYPTRRSLSLPHAHGIYWSSTGAQNSDCFIYGGAEAGLPDGTFVTLNQIVYQAKAGHIFYGQVFMAAGMSPTVYPLIALGSTTSGLSAGGNPTMCIAISSGGTLPTAGVTDSFVMYAAQVAGGDQCPHFRTADNKTILLKQRRKSDFNNWASLSDVVNALVANGIFDQA
jgi:hypothetical protein